MSSYRFDESDLGYDVYYRGQNIGTIHASKESSGRHCFYLGCDNRKNRRTYRGKQKAAEALHIIHRLVANQEKEDWTIDQLIIHAWDARPRASDTNS